LSSTQPDTASTGGQVTENPPPPVHRSVHPLPPKPTGVPPPPPPTLPSASSSYVDHKILHRQHSSSHHGGEVKPRVNSHPHSQAPSNRRSASPPRQQETDYRQRNHDRIKANGEGSSVAVTDNADVRRRGTAAMEVYR
jgi:hypothetical protein